MKNKSNVFNKYKFSSAIKEKKLSAIEKNGKHLTLRYFEAEIGVSAATLSRIENGAVPDVETFCKLLKWLNKPATDFLMPMTAQEILKKLVAQKPVTLFTRAAEKYINDHELSLQFLKEIHHQIISVPQKSHQTFGELTDVIKDFFLNNKI